MVGEILEIYTPEMAKSAVKLSTMSTTTLHLRWVFLPLLYREKCPATLVFY